MLDFVSELSLQQEQAIKAVKAWIRDGGQQVFYLSGYAGTGKTTIARLLAEDVRGVKFASYTGKAASVMRRKGCVGATTLHDLIYIPVQLYHCNEHGDTPTPRKGACEKCGRPRTPRGVEFVLNNDSDLHHANLLIIDECSMVGEDLGEDLLGFDKPVLVIGDPGQLPPVKGVGFFSGDTPDIMLTELHRWARDSPIIDMATRVREGRTLKYGMYGESRLTRERDLAAEDLAGNEMRLAWTNTEVHVLNDKYRAWRGITSKLPVVGDRVLCLRNNHAKGLLNGTLWDVAAVHRQEYGHTRMEIVSEDGLRVTVNAPDKFFGKYTFDDQAELTNESFGFGYAMTVHKAQGSQWDDLLLRDSGNTDKRWLYTGITRAAKRITVVRG